MATPEQCPFYNECGFVKFRKERPFANVVPIPTSGDCGKDPNTCGRLASYVPVTINYDYASFGPQTAEEFDIALPKVIPNSNGEVTHRILGGVDM